MTQNICDLTWYPDLDAACREAVRSGRPILSLRLLGRLDEPLSCANSRFFRAHLYPHPAVRRLFQRGFVLHWQSVRPVPVMTIDFGDGRRIQRTITGNSVHLVLDTHGRTIDAIPGMMDATTFVRLLSAAAEVARTDRERLPRWHAAQRDAIDQAWQRALALHGIRASGASALEAATSDEVWRRLAGDTRPANRSEARAAGRIAATKMMVERPLLDAVSPASLSLAEDTLRNRLALHRQIHAHFADGDASEHPDALTEWIYDAVFRMPADDPFLGLESADPVELRV